MQAWKVTEDELKQAAREVGVRLYNVGRSGRAVRFTLKTDSHRTTGPEGKAPYRRMSRNRGMDSRVTGRPRTVPGAVCWHGHRDFLWRVFELRPGARIKSAMADYRGREDFERTYRDTRQEGGEWMGYSMRPYEDACFCPASGHGWSR